MDEHPSVARAREILQVARNDELRALLRYWLAIHPRTGLPGRAAFDPLEVPRALPSLVLTDVERDPFRFRVRLMGTAIVAAFGRDFTGRYLHEVLAGFERDYSYLHRVEVAETGLPNYRHGDPAMPFKLDFAPLERVYLPFAADGRQVDMILAMAVYLAPPSRLEAGAAAR